MQEELIERLISVEKDAGRLKAEAENEIKDLQKKYQERISREERVKISEAKNRGKKLVEDMTAEADKYAKRVQKEMEKEITESEKKYKEVKDALLNKYFKKIIRVKGV